MKRYLLAIFILFCLPALTGFIVCMVVSQNTCVKLQESGHSAGAGWGTAATYGNKLGMLSVDMVGQTPVQSNESIPAVNPLTMFSQIP